MLVLLSLDAAQIARRVVEAIAVNVVDLRPFLESELAPQPEDAWCM